MFAISILVRKAKIVEVLSSLRAFSRLYDIVTVFRKDTFWDCSVYPPKHMIDHNETTNARESRFASNLTVISIIHRPNEHKFVKFYIKIRYNK